MFRPALLAAVCCIGFSIAHAQTAGLTKNHPSLRSAMSSAQFTFTNTGRLGIGTAAPESTLQIKSDYFSQLSITHPSAGLAQFFMNNDAMPTSSWLISSYADTTGSLANFDINYTDDVESPDPEIRIQGDGNIAIGSTVSNHPLEVHSKELATDTMDIVLGIVGDSSNRPAIAFAERTPVGPESGMIVEYDGSPDGGFDQRLNFRNSLGTTVHSFDMGGTIKLGHPNVNYPAGIEIRSGIFDLVKLIRTTNAPAAINFGNEDKPGTLWRLRAKPDSVQQSATLGIYHNDGDVQTNALWILGNGHIGLDTLQPDGRLHLVHNSPDAFSSPNLHITESDYDYARLQFDNTERPGAFWHIAGRADNDSTLAKLNIFYADTTAGKNILSVSGSGQVGINTTEPSGVLEVRVPEGVIPRNLVLSTPSDDSYTGIVHTRDALPDAAWILEGFTSDDPSLATYALYHANSGDFGGGFRLYADGRTFMNSPTVIQGEGSFNSGTDIVLSLLSDGSNEPAIHFTGVPVAEPELNGGMTIAYNGNFITERLSILGTTGDEEFRFDDNGNAYKPGGGSWTAISDRRMKQDIVEYKAGLESIKAIRPVRYRYNDLSGYDTGEQYVGVIAQELQETAPSMVSTFVDDSGDEYLSVNTSELDFMLVNAVKELAEQNRQQAEMILALQEQNAKLERTLGELLKLETNSKSAD